MENGKLQSLGEALEDFENLDEVDDVFGLEIQVHPGLRLPGLHSLHGHPTHQQIIQQPAMKW